MKTLVATVGLPRSGKSTWARTTGYPIVCPDAIRLALHGHAYIQAAEPFVWAIAHTMVYALFEAGHDTVILDACNNTRKRRDEWKSHAYDLWFKVFRTDTAECLARAEFHSDPAMIKDVITRMAAQREDLQPGEVEYPCLTSLGWEKREGSTGGAVAESKGA